MKLPLIIVSGKNGQLGKELQEIAHDYPQFDFLFCGKDEMNIAKIDSVEKIFALHNPAYFINCAAYTAVDKAESEQEAAYTINAEAPGNIARLCKKNKTCLIHISTDYVFNGQATKPYTETDATQPINYYGYSKWLGEELALQNNEQTIIIRTSWVYSKYGNNFVKTMLRLMNEREEINVVNDQHGSPTYAKDIAKAIMQIASAKNFQKGIYHFSNDGIISWFDFACAIRQIKQLKCKVNPIDSTAYPTPAKRPFYSGLDKTKITTAFHIQLKNWKDSLAECLASF